MLRFLLVFLVSFNVAFAADKLTERTLIGKWTDKQGRYNYTFDKGYDFEYIEADSTKPYQMLGVWMFGEAGTCSTSKEENGKTISLNNGNLMIYADTTRCCFQAHFVGANLLLESLTPDSYYGVCKDHVLVRQPR
jgi:hypothetical protein